MLNDRKCTVCGHYAEDLIENRVAVQQELVMCPACLKDTFKKVWRPGYVAPDGTHSFNAHIEKMREQSANGHGNTSLKVG